MKWRFLTSILVLITVLMVACGNKNTCIHYIGKYFTFTSADSGATEQKIILSSYKKKKADAGNVIFTLEYSGQHKEVNKLISMELKLYAKDASTNNFSKELSAVTYYTKETWHSEDQKGIEKFTQPLSEIYEIPNTAMIPLEAKIKLLEKEKIVIVAFEYNMPEYPNELKATILVKTTEGDQEFSVNMPVEEVESCGGKVRTNPFG